MISVKFTETEKRWRSTNAFLVMLTSFLVVSVMKRYSWDIWYAWSIIHKITIYYTWEQRKLGEVVERFDNLRIPVTSSKRERGITPYYGANGIQDYVQGYTHDGEFVLVAEDGANDLQNYPIHYVNGKVWVNNHAHVLQGKKDIADNLFLVNAIKRIKFETYLVGGSRAKLNADVMMKLPIKVPTLNEQQKLGKYFSRIDSLIALHQRKPDYQKWRYWNDNE